MDYFFKNGAKQVRDYAASLEKKYGNLRLKKFIKEITIL